MKKVIYMLLIIITFLFSSCNINDTGIIHSVTITGCLKCQLHDYDNSLIGKSEVGEIIRFKEFISKPKELYLIPSFEESNSVNIRVSLGDTLFLNEVISLKRSEFIVISLNGELSKVFNYLKQESL